MNKKEFIERISKVAIENYSEYNILPSLAVAQAALESGWGKKHIQNNIYGIKADKSWTGKVATRKTREWNGKKYIIKNDKFRAYDSLKESVLDYLKLLGKSKRYERVRRAKDYKEACRLVYESGYATDPKYSEKLINIIETNKLYLYDQKIEPISHWAKDAWNWAVKKGITDGTNPKRYATREEVVTMLYRFDTR
jgi:flagellum-specific peptidoglycan hydrolase FlgJ